MGWVCKLSPAGCCQELGARRWLLLASSPTAEFRPIDGRFGGCRPNQLHCLPCQFHSRYDMCNASYIECPRGSASSMYPRHRRAAQCYMYDRRAVLRWRFFDCTSPTEMNERRRRTATAPRRGRDVGRGKRTKKRKETGRKPHSPCALRIAQARYIYISIINSMFIPPPAQCPPPPAHRPAALPIYLSIYLSMYIYTSGLLYIHMRMWHPSSILTPPPCRRMSVNASSLYILTVYDLPPSVTERAAEPPRPSSAISDYVARPYSIIHRPHARMYVPVRAPYEWHACRGTSTPMRGAPPLQWAARPSVRAVLLS